MGEKTAGIKVNIKGDAKGIREIGDETKRQAGGMKSALSDALSTGVKGGTDAVKGMLSTLKNGIGMIGGLMGGLGAAELVKGAIDSKAKFSDLSFSVRSAGGSMREVAEIQKQLQAGAIATAQDSMKMVDVFEGIKGETGSLAFAKGSIDDVAVAARGAHKPLEQMGAIAGTLAEKFGVGAGEELQGGLADVVSLSKKGGVEFDELAQKLGVIGAYAKAAGLEGRGGLGQIVGMLNVADDSGKNFKKNLSAIGALTEQLGSSAGKQKIGAALGLSQKDLGGNMQSQIEAIMKATGGKKEKLEKIASGGQLEFLVDVGKKYAGTFAATSGDVKTKQAAALSALQASFEAASRSSITFADLQKEAADQMNEAPQKIAQAKEKLAQAMQSDKMQAALGKIIDKLPALADGLAKLLDMIADNPLAAGAAAVGGTFAKGALESAIVGAFKSGAAAAGPSLAASMASSASPFAASLAPLMGPIGLALGASIGIMLIASMHQAKLDQEKRDAEAKDAQNMLKQNKGPLGGAYQAAGALEAATGLEFDPNTAISDATAGQSTSNQDNRDKAMAERLLAKGKRENAALATGNALASRHPEWFIDSTPGGAGATSADPLAGGVSGARGRAGVPGASGSSSTAAPAVDPAAMGQAFKMAFPQEQRVFVANAKDIGGSSGPTGATLTLKPGWVPR